jgi:hypothetical protein
MQSKQTINSSVLNEGILSSQGSDKLLEIDGAVFRANFNQKSFLINHHLADHHLFDLARILELATKLPPDCVEYNAGNVTVNQDPTLTPQTGLSVQETIRRIEESNSWMVLKNVEKDEEYRKLLDDCLDEIEAFSDSLSTGMFKREGFIFITSPGAVTPYHIDNEYNFLLQIRGTKTMNTFDRSDRELVSDQDLETFYCGAHRNLVFKDEFQLKSVPFELSPGYGVHIPVTTPHWVKNGDSVSISFSITFRTVESERRSIVYQVNSLLRKLGVKPTPFGVSALGDSIKYQLYRVYRRMNGIQSRFRSNGDTQVAADAS